VTPPRRRTPAEADALVAHLTPAQRRRQIGILTIALRIRGIEVEEFFDAAGRSFLKFDLDQVRAISPALAELLIAEGQTMPEPIPHRPGVA
jgi:hypothetical protein